MDRLLAEAALHFQPHHHRIGPTPDGIIFHYVIASSTFEGPLIHLSAVPNCGGEWGTMRGDGVMAFESRHVLRAPTDDLICTTFSGLYELGDDGYVDALDDTLTSKARAELAIRFHTTAKDYRWLNHVQFIGLGERDFGSHTLGLRIIAPESLCTT